MKTLILRPFVFLGYMAFFMVIGLYAVAEFSWGASGEWFYRSH